MRPPETNGRRGQRRWAAGAPCMALAGPAACRPSSCALNTRLYPPPPPPLPPPTHLVAEAAGHRAALQQRRDLRPEGAHHLKRGQVKRHADPRFACQLHRALQQALVVQAVCAMAARMGLCVQPYAAHVSVGQRAGMYAKEGMDCMQAGGVDVRPMMACEGWIQVLQAMWGAAQASCPLPQNSCSNAPRCRASPFTLPIAQGAANSSRGCACAGSTPLPCAIDGPSLVCTPA
jgi:hypothetical protein